MKSVIATNSRALSAGDYRTLAQFRFLLRQFAQFSEAAARGAGLTPQHHQALLAIKGHAPEERLTVGALADCLHVRPHSAVGLANRLRAKRLVCRIRDPADGRRVMLALTPRAQRILANLSATHREELRRVAPLLGKLLRRLQRG